MVFNKTTNQLRSVLIKETDQFPDVFTPKGYILISFKINLFVRY